MSVCKYPLADIIYIQRKKPNRDYNLANYFFELFEGFEPALLSAEKFVSAKKRKSS